MSAEKPKKKPPATLKRRITLWLVFGLIGLMVAPLVLGLAYRFVPPPVSSYMLLKLPQHGKIDARWRSLDEISPHLPRAVIMSEDGQFCQHNGVDWKALRDVIEAAEDGLPTRGASTIAMQTARNLFLWPHRSVIRKGIEIPLALYLDLVWPKRRVVEVYLNIAEWGPGIFGAEAASQHHFGKSAIDLTAQESALLAASLPNPFVRNAGRAGPKTRNLARIIRGRMRGADPWVACINR